MKCQYFREWALYGIKPVPTKPSVHQYWWPSVNLVNTCANKLFQFDTTLWLKKLRLNSNRLLVVASLKQCPLVS